MMPMCSISEAFRVLKGNEIRRHGEYRRTCLLLEGGPVGSRRLV